MKDKVVLKGTKSGIILVLDNDISFEELKDEVAKKFSESADFLGEVKKAILFRGRKLTEAQKMELVHIIQENSKMTIVCILEEDEQLEKTFQVTMEKQQVALDYSTGQFFKGNLRSGQVLDVETSIIIIGDVKAGAKVISKGNVIILGALRGNVYAGADGNYNAFVVALDMEPMQIRIADTIARSSDEPKKRKKKEVKETKVAFYEDGNIYIEPLDRDVIDDIKL